MSKYAKHVSTRQTPQSEAIPGSDQVANSAGGFSYQVDCWCKLERFLILGNEGGSYYASERKMTQSNCKSLLECAAADPQRAVDVICDVSEKARAPKNDAAIFAMARLSAVPECAELVRDNLHRVCRIGTHLFAFLDAMQEFRGWGGHMKTAVRRWFTERKPESLALQVTKYRQRDGWSMLDVVRKAHIKADNRATNAVLSWVTGRGRDVEHLPVLITAYEAAQTTPIAELPALIREAGLSREHLPTEALNDKGVWEALLERMPATALVRNLNKLTSIGVCGPLSQGSKDVAAKLADHDWLKRSRMHPFQVLVARSIYSSGHGLRGNSTWTPDNGIVTALDEAFHGTFQNIEPTNMNYLLALDVSGSMTCDTICGSHLTPRDGSAAMAMITHRTEPNCHIVGFTGGGGGGWRNRNQDVDELSVLSWSRNASLEEVIRKVSGLPFGGTDCALPMLYATHNKIDVDCFVVYTDSETWAGAIHPVQALQAYRKAMNKPHAKLVVVGMVANDFSIADPNDAGMMDIVGFDTNVPKLLSDFAGRP